VPTEAPESRRDADSAHAGWFADVGWQTTLDGDALEQGLATRLGVEQTPWFLGVGATLGTGTPHYGQYATFDVSRHAITAFAGFGIAHTSSFFFDAELSAGALLLRRATLLAPSPAQGTPPTLSAAGLAGAGVALRWRPVSPLRTALRLDAGLDFVPWPPAFGYQLGATFLPAFRVSPVQPRAQLAVEVSTF
jgi:hypothetical protein